MYLFFRQSHSAIRNMVLFAAQQAAYVVGAGPLAAALISSLLSKIDYLNKIEQSVTDNLVNIGFQHHRVAEAILVNGQVGVASI